MDPLDVGLGLSMVIGSAGGVWFLSMFARALAKKWGTPRDAPPPADVQELRHAISRLGTEVSELQERMDFAERLLTRASAAQREPPHSPADR